MSAFKLFNPKLPFCEHSSPVGGNPQFLKAKNDLSWKLTRKKKYIYIQNTVTLIPSKDAMETVPHWKRRHLQKVARPLGGGKGCPWAGVHGGEAELSSKAGTARASVYGHCSGWLGEDMHMRRRSFPPPASMHCTCMLYSCSQHRFWSLLVCRG